jgi:glycosyltransferase involved in cell wall biosynthesis
MEASTTHLVLIPSYNTGPRLLETVCAASQFWNPVWVVVDGSTDGTAEKLTEFAATREGIQVMVLPRNRGKGAALLHGLREAERRRFTHALTMDADGQHPAERIPEFMRSSQLHPERLILGRPVFDASAPAARIRGRAISNFFANLETLWLGIGDSLYGFRVYPISALVQLMKFNPFMRHFDFDPEAAVRLVWRGFLPLNLPAECRYFTREAGGVSHFHYVRTNIVLTWMHLRLLIGSLIRLPWLIRLRRRYGSTGSQRAR